MKQVYSSQNYKSITYRIMFCIISCGMLLALTSSWANSLQEVMSFEQYTIFVFSLCFTLLATSLLYAAKPLILGALGECKERLPGSMVLIVLGITLLGIGVLISGISSITFEHLALCETFTFECIAALLVVLIGYAFDAHIRINLASSPFSSFWPFVMSMSVMILAILVAAGGALVWFYFSSNLALCLDVAAGVLLVACPQLFVMNAPLVAIAINKAVKKCGITINNYAAFNTLCDLDMIIFSKRGILTEGTYEVVDSIPCSDMSSDDLLAKVASIELHNTHPIARAFVDRAQALSLSITPAQEYSALPGRGVSGVVAQERIFVGNIRILDSFTFTSTDVQKQLKEIKKSMKKLALASKTPLLVCSEQRILGVVACKDTLRAGAASLIKNLNKRGFDCVLMTGEGRHNSGVLARELSFEKVMSDVLPKKKATHIKKLQRAGKKVGFIGDRTVDRASFKAADVSIEWAEHSPDERAPQSSLTITRPNLYSIRDAFALSCSGKRKRVVATLFACAYNVMGFIFALRIFQEWTFQYMPVLCAAGMVASTLFIVLYTRIIFYRCQSAT